MLLCYNLFGDRVKKSILIIILSGVLLIFSGFVFFTKIINNDDEKTMLKRQKLNEHIKEYTKEEFDLIVSDNFGLGSLVNKKSLSEMTNSERLRMIINEYKGTDRYNTFSEEELNKIHSSSVIKDLSIIYENLYNYYGTFDWDNMNVAYQYDSNNKTFTYTGALGHGGVARGNIIYKDLVSLDTNGHTYTVKYKYIFYNSMGEGPSDVKLYLNIDDALNNKNEWAYLEVGEDNSTHSSEYIKEHYDEVKDKLPEYTYIFKVEDNHLVITDYFVK